MKRNMGHVFRCPWNPLDVILSLKTYSVYPSNISLNLREYICHVMGTRTWCCFNVEYRCLVLIQLAYCEYCLWKFLIVCLQLFILRRCSASVMKLSAIPFRPDKRLRLYGFLWRTGTAFSTLHIFTQQKPWISRYITLEMTVRTRANFQIYMKAILI